MIEDRTTLVERILRKDESVLNEEEELDSPVLLFNELSEAEWEKKRISFAVRKVYDLIISRMHRLADSVKRVLSIVQLSLFSQHSYYKWNHLFKTSIYIRSSYFVVVLTYRLADSGFGMMESTHIPPVTHCMGNCARSELTSIIQFDMMKLVTCRKIENIINPSSALSQKNVVN